MTQLERMELFFNKDVEIKKEIMGCSFNESESYSEDVVIQYEETLYDTLKSIKYDLDKICDSFNINECKELLDEMFQVYFQKLANCSGNLDKLKKFYQVCMSDMAPKLINRVNNEFKGYYLFNNSIYSLLKDCNSINEILHVFHTNIVNNELNYQTITCLDEKTNNEGESIKIYGSADDDALNIYNKFPVEMPCGGVDILSIPSSNKILMMIRDRGHALTVEIDKSEAPDIYVDYLIPKVCNIDKVNELPGVRKVDKNDRYDNGLIATHGTFRTTQEDLANDVLRFISLVPMDIATDYVYEGGRQM